MSSNPAKLVAYDPAWPLVAARWLTAIEKRLAGLAGAHRALYDHIGSTSVPGLAAKPFVDLRCASRRYRLRRS